MIGALLVVIVGLIVMSTLYMNNIRNKPVHCVQKTDNSTLDIYYEFEDGKIFRYTSVTTSKGIENSEVEKRKKMNEINDEKYPQYVVKGWLIDDTYTTMEVFDFDYLPDADAKNLTGTTSTEWKNMTRQQLLKNFNRFGNEKKGEFTCK